MFSCQRISAFLFLGLLLGASQQAACVGEVPSHPNLLFLLVDDMGWADLGCYGQQAYATPNLDRLAAEGTRFTQAYSGCTVCAPARCTLMTGLHMGHCAVRGNSGGIALPDSAVTLPEVLQQAGYRCGGFGKWGLGDIGSEGAPERQGFDLFYGYYHQIHAHNYYPKYLVRNSQKEMLDKGAYSHYLIVEETREFIRANSGQPFFCYAAWTPPHARYQIPKDDPAWQAVKDKPWPKPARGHAAFNLMLDRQVGELLELLEELKIDDKTIVFFCSDHGSSGRFEGSLNSCGPLTGQKRSMHEGGLRTPLIVRWP
ncbi:MAG: sulfatase-like hydrolase/transferase, partial [Pirellulales bacterium]|nr:sulfatase-like hydrolase/transferase [Pirellulales bacterium]